MSIKSLFLKLFWKKEKTLPLSGNFLFVAAHEIKTSLTAISGFTELLSGSVKYMPKDVRDRFNQLDSAVGNLKELLGELLEISGSEYEVKRMILGPVDLLSLINELVSRVSPLSSELRVEIGIRVQDTLPPVLADPAKLKEIVLNILTNAIKYNKLGGRVDITILTLDHTVIIEFRDTGCGIPKGEMRMVFEKFFRSSISREKQISGTGLGLFITKMWVEKMGGQISMSSTEGFGTTVAFSLPLAQDRTISDK
jgi:signal transduction histidine kinase